MGPFNPRVRSSATERQVKNWLNFTSTSSGGGAISIQSIQFGSIAIAGANLTATAAISAVVIANCLIIFTGCKTSDATASDLVEGFAKLTLTGTTTVTATRGGDGDSSTTTIGFCIVEFAAGVLKSSGSGSITIASGASSNTQTISAVVTANTIITGTGCAPTDTGTVGIGKLPGLITLTNTTTITASTGVNVASSGHSVGYSYVEFNKLS